MRTLLLLILFAASSSAQNVAVRFAGKLNTDWLPEFWPAAIQPCGTQKEVKGLTVMTWGELNHIVSTNRTAYAALASAQVKAEAEKADDTLKQAEAVLAQAKSTLAVCTNTLATLQAGKVTAESLEALVTTLKAELVKITVTDVTEIAP